MTNQSLLAAIKSPQDLKNLMPEQLIQLAAEIRKKIIDVMSVNGGHLASSLGSVELTIALHRVFHSPTDKLIWDVGHQTYPHKLLTGRYDRFTTVRQYQGLCGFTHPKESPYDHFHAGHAGTALSLALGVAHTRDLNDGNEYVIPVIGDATLTCGVSLEALNNIQRDMKRFIVILNDNAMSISKNVGAITGILSRMISNPTISKWHQELDNLISKIPSYGPTLAQQGRKLSESLKNLVSEGAFFEQYGLNYIGPIDGHDVHKMIEVLEGIKNSQWPVVIHLLTNKGHGMEVASNNPITYHGAKPFCLHTGKFHPAKNNQPTFPKIFGKEILQMAEEDEKIVVITPAMLQGSCLDDLREKIPSRCLDVGIAESHAVTFAGGLAYEGKSKVVVSIYATFLQRALDNLFHDVCLQELPVVFCIDRAGLSGPDGSTHHGIYEISFLNAMPNMVIAQPRDGQVLKELMHSAFSYQRPTAIRYPNMATDEAAKPLQHRPVGKGEVLVRGKGMLIFALGHMNKTALEVREKMKALGIMATVADPVFIKPLDSELLCDLLMDHDRIITLEEHVVSSGLGAILNNFLMGQGYGQLQVLNIGIPESFPEHGQYDKLIDALGLTTEKIFQRIISHFSIKKTTSEFAEEVF